MSNVKFLLIHFPDLSLIKINCKERFLFAFSQENEEKTPGKSEEKNKEKFEKFSKIFDDYFEKLYKFFFFRLRNQQDAEDLTSETFERIVKKFHQYEDRGFPLSAWIFKLAKNILIDFLRKKKLFIKSIDELNPSEQFANNFDLEKLDEKLLTEEIWEIIKTLPEKQQLIWSLKLTSGLTHKEIGDVIQIPRTNVNVIVHRSLQTIKSRLKHLKKS